MDVYISGNNAYLADADAGLQILDISTLSSPSLIRNYTTPRYAMSVYVSENYAYIADRDSGLKIIDITDIIF